MNYYEHSCVCGCGGKIEIKEHHKYCGTPKYLLGHNGTHWETKSKLCFVWKAMKSRILNPNNKFYKDYGGRGITICDEWLEFIPFRDWSLNNGYQEGLQIDRKINNGNYEPNNCRFVTAKENCQNRSTTKLTQELVKEIRYLHAKGKFTQKELAKKYGISKTVISYIINNKIWKKGE